MKKLILVLLFSLLAAGCDTVNSNQPANQVQATQQAQPEQPKVSEPEVTPAPIPKQEAPKPKPQCDPNYSGCVPIASDVDCAGGSGNGPAYVQGPVYVIGEDIYGLDGRNNDGIGCE